MDLRLPIAFAGAFIVLVSAWGLAKTRATPGTFGHEIVGGLALAIGIVLILTAPFLAGLISYTTGGQFVFTWWW